MFLGHFSEEQMERLRNARKWKRYSHLQTWQELFTYSLTIADIKERKDIGNFAAKFNKGENITLPLKDYIKPPKTTLL
jgi:hypothetical protein